MFHISLLQCISCNEVYIVDPLFGCGVAMFVNLFHDSAKVHGLCDDLVVVWYLT